MAERKPPIKPVGQIVRPRSWGIYGRSGSGKTTFASTFPKPILLLDVNDQGTDSVADVKQLDVWEIEDWEDFEDVLHFLLHNEGKYKTLVIDTITQMEDFCKQWVLSTKKKRPGNIGNWGALTMREYGEVAASMKTKITDFRNLPMEVMFIAQERTTHQEEDKAEDPDNLMIPEIGPYAMKSVASHLNASVKIIGHAFVKLRKFKQKVRNKEVDMEEPVHCLRLGANPIYITKTRKPRGIEIPAYVENPEYKDVIEVLKGD
jgi:hypothetical protein